MRTTAACVSRLPSGSSSGRPDVGAEETLALARSSCAAPLSGSTSMMARRCVVEHQGATRIVHQADGSIICEPVGPSSGYAAPTGGAPGRASKAASVVALAAAEHHEDDEGFQICGHQVLGIRNLDELRGLLLASAVGLAKATVTLGAVVGLLVAGTEAERAVAWNLKADTGKIVSRVNEVVRCCVVGALAGAVAVPAVTVLSLLRMAVRPVLLGAAVHGVVSWAARHRMSAVAILKKLQSGDLSRQLEALRRLVARLEASAPFCAQFKRLAGIEVLLKLLQDWLDAAERGSQGLLGSSPGAALATRALAYLSKQGDAVDTMVELGGVPTLLRAVSYGLASCTVPLSGSLSPTAGAGAGSGSASLSSSAFLVGGARGSGLLLGPAAPTVGLGEAGAGAGAPPSCAGLLLYATTALARVASGHAVAQQLLASESGAAQLVVSVLEASTAHNLRGATVEACDALRGHAVSLAQSLALEPVGKAALGQAGAVEALAAALLLSSPWTQGQEAAAAALHSLVRGDMDNQRRLANLAPAGLSAALHRALAASPSGSNNNGCNNSAGCNNNSAGSSNASAGSTTLGVSGGAGGMMMGVGGQSGGAGGSGAQAGGRPVSPQDCHWHRADLLALSNVISRFTQQPAAPQQQQQQPARGLGSTPTALPPAAAAVPVAAHPVTTLAQRLGLRRPTAPPAPKATDAPRPSLDLEAPHAPHAPASSTATATSSAAASSGGSSSSTTTTSASTTSSAVAAALSMSMLPATPPILTSHADAASPLGHGVQALGSDSEDGVVAHVTPTASGLVVAGGGGGNLKGALVVPGSPESDDWEQDCGVPAEVEVGKAAAAVAGAAPVLGA